MTTPIDACHAVAAPVPTLYGTQLPEPLRAITLKLGQAPQLVWTMLDGKGNPLNLATCPLAATTPVQLLTAEFSAQNQAQVALITPGDIVDAAAGVVQALVDPAQLGGSGIYDAQFVVRDPADNILFNNRLLLVIERNLTTSTATGPPTAMEIRLLLRDSPGQNLLLDEVAFTDAEVALAAGLVVSYWNELPPPLHVAYTTQTFPYRYNWIQGIIAQLYFIAAEFYRRNRLAYSSGGMSVDDLNKEANYVQIGQLKWQEFKDWALAAKISLNRDEGWGLFNSPYYHTGQNLGY